jgi:hypothetical protein
MSVQKTPDRRGGLDDKKVHWEEDLKPFKRLPREPRDYPRQRVPAIIPMLVSFALVGVACFLAATFINQNRPALNFSLPTATIEIITPTPTEDIPPTATPYVAPTETPVAQPTGALPGLAGPINVGSRVVIVDTGGNGLNFRREPSTAAEKIRSLPEGTIYDVVGGPQEGGGYVWWQLRDPTDGTIGWGVQNYMRLAPS